ncbi:4Fe-4S dicluster domain-containing protein [Clostridium nigeriense]|uniref:4Fe-4S dicluster domain-containing protein n=1 Tax=Clostridium nigeriense TaxID=1805470 RepID=UPI003D3267A2
MLSNLFNNVSVCNEMFALKDTNLSDVLSKKINSEELDDNEIDKSLSIPYENNKGKKVVIKAFSFQPNLNGYGIIVNERKEELKKGLEKIKSLNEVKFVINKKDKTLINYLNEFGQVIKVPTITDLYEDKIISKAYGNSKDVIVYDILDIIRLGQSLLGKSVEGFVTVYGSAVKGNKVLIINKSNTYKEIFETLNGKEEELIKVINGGSLNGTPIYDLNSIVSIESKGLLFLSEKDLPSKENFSCINCAKCLRVCPEGLNPIKLMNLYKRNEKEEFIKFGGEKCIDCGLCSFICPSNLEIAQTIKTAKSFN